jgi:hypothetical protein
VRPETVAKQQEEALSRMLAVMVKQHASGQLHAVLVALVFFGSISVDFSIKSALLLKSFKLIPGICITKMHTAQRTNRC